MAASARRGPAPIASFDHDGSDESSPETKNFRLPEIHEDSSSASASTAADAGGSGSGAGNSGCLGGGAGGEAARARSASTPGLAPAAPRIDISRASSSSHQDSRDSSPELALASGGLGFREDGALDLRSSTEELAFLETGATGPTGAAGGAPPPGRRHSRKDSQGSETALLAVSGRTSRLSSVGSQCSAHSALSAFSRVSHLSVASGASRSPSPHKMLLETSFCGPKPIETESEIGAAAEERLLELTVRPPPVEVPAAPEPPEPSAPSAPVPSAARETRDCRRVRAEVTVERTAAPPSPVASGPAPATAAPTLAVVPTRTPDTARTSPATVIVPDDDKNRKETKNRAKAEGRQARSRERRDPSENRTKSRSKDIIRIRLKPEHEYDDDDEADLDDEDPVPAAATAGERATRPTELAAERVPARGSRTPSPSGVIVSRKSSFCSLFKSRETIASPDSPSDAHRRKKSLNDGRSRSRSRDRSTTPTSAAKIRGSVLSLFRTPRRGAASPRSRSRSPAPPTAATAAAATPAAAPRPPPDRLKYYEQAEGGIIHIPLRTPPGEPRASPACPAPPFSTAGPTPVSSSPPVVAERRSPKPIRRTVLPDGSIIIPLHSPTERTRGDVVFSSAPAATPTPTPTVDRTPDSGRVGEDNSTGAGHEERRRSSDNEECRSSSGSEAAVAMTAKTPAAVGPRSPPPASDHPRRRERLVFATNVGSRDQVFCTQFSITKTPSVTSETSGSPPSPREVAAAGGMSAAAVSPAEGARDSSGSEASSEAAPARCGSDVEQRGLVIQESFEELPYVPTTLPQERSLALPMVPVRERGGLRVAARGRPRPPPAAPAAVPAVVPAEVPAVVPAAVPAAVAAPPPAVERIRIQLPRRPRAASAAAPSARPERTRTRSGSEGLEARPKGSWIDFEDVPERRKQPKRIQTLPARELVSYAAPEDCRCECHARPHSPQSEECGEHARGAPS